MKTIQESVILQEVQKYPHVRKEQVFNTMKEYAYLFNDMNPSYGVPLTIDDKRVKIKSIGEMKEKKETVFAGDVLELKIPAVIKENNIREFAPRFLVRFGSIEGNVGIPTILHEMIHMYQICMKHCYIRFRRVPEFMTERSEEKLNTEIENHYPDVKKNLGIAYAISSMSMSESLKCHNMLFLSKSLQLDCELGYELGTVFGYGLTEYIKQSSTIAC